MCVTARRGIGQGSTPESSNIDMWTNEWVFTEQDKYACRLLAPEQHALPYSSIGMWEQMFAHSHVSSLVCFYLLAVSVKQKHLPHVACYVLVPEGISCHCGLSVELQLANSCDSSRTKTRSYHTFLQLHQLPLSCWINSCLPISNL
jgi:hypothetical protein